MTAAERRLIVDELADEIVKRTNQILKIMKTLEILINKLFEDTKASRIATYVFCIIAAAYFIISIIIR